ELVDVDGDGLPDMLVGRPNQYGYYRNMGAGEWRANVTSVQGSPPYELQSLNNTLADLNAEGVSAVVHNDATSFLYYASRASNPRLADDQHGFAPPTQFSSSTRFDISSQGVQFVDLDGDKRPDVVLGVRDGEVNRFFCWINRGGQGWSDQIELRP